MTQSLSLASQPEEVPETVGNYQGNNEAKQGVKNKCKVLPIKCTIPLAISFIFNIIGIITIIVILSPATKHFCQDDWIGFQGHCYYFSKQEGDWNSSRSNCSTQHADLTVIDTIEEMDFLRQHKCTSDHWIGLQMTENQTGKWVNGAIFNKWFDVKGDGECAYFGDDDIATARCYTERKWICRVGKGTRSK